MGCVFLGLNVRSWQLPLPVSWNAYSSPWASMWEAGKFGGETLEKGPETQRQREAHPSSRLHESQRHACKAFFSLINQRWQTMWTHMLAAWFCRCNFVRTQPQPFIYILSVATFTLQQQGWETLCPTTPKVFTIWPFTKKVCDPCCRSPQTLPNDCRWHYIENLSSKLGLYFQTIKIMKYNNEMLIVLSHLF